MQVRAAALSGECNVLHEIYRGTYTKFSGGQQDCVRRRAVKSLNMNPNCKVLFGCVQRIVDSFCVVGTFEVKCLASTTSTLQAISEKAVNEVFEKCFTDELPFKTGKPVLFDKDLK